MLTVFLGTFNIYCIGQFFTFVNCIPLTRAATILHAAPAIIVSFAEIFTLFSGKCSIVNIIIWIVKTLNNMISVLVTTKA